MLKGFYRFCTVLGALALAAITVNHVPGQQISNPNDLEKGDTPRPLSLKPTRNIRFTTDEGTWISLDLSPDGKTIVFELLGDLYTVPITGGEAKPITTGMAFDSQPRFSPDGKHLTFISDRDGADNVWISDADGSHPRVLTKERHTDLVSPEWTPDGRSILVEKSSDVFGGRELWAYDTLGGNGIPVTKASPEPKTPIDQQISISGAVSSPDGRYLYYSRRHGVFGYDAVFPLWQMVRRDTATGVEDEITAEQGSAIRPRISPDGKWLVYGTRLNAKSGLRARNLSTGAEHWLAYPIDRDEQEGLGTRDVLPGYAFTPDSQAVIASFGGHIHRVGMGDGEDTLIPFKAEVNQQLGPFVHSDHRVETGPVEARIASGLEMSPDGKQAAFSALAHVFIADLTTGKSRRLTSSNEAEFQPAWSPDGNSVAYVTWNAEAGGAVWKSTAAGPSKPVKLTTIPSFFTELAWSPDGSSILALRSSVEARHERRVEFNFGQGGSTPGIDIVRIPAAGGDYATLVPARGATHLQFVRGSDRLYVNNSKGLVSMRTDGTDVQEIVVVKARDIQGQKDPVNSQQVMISPDGLRAAALVNHNAWLLDLPRIGGPAVELDASKPGLAAKRLNTVGIDNIGWSPEGSQIFWTTGATVFRLPLDAALKAELEEAEKPQPAKSGIAITPDASKDKGKAKDPKEVPSKPLPGLPIIQTALHVEEPRAVPSGTVVLRGAKVITMDGNKVFDKADIVVTGDRITAVGPQDTIKVPTDATLLDVSGKTVIPGIVNIHAHWTELRRGVLELEDWPFEASLAYGVTSGRDPQTFTEDIFAYQDLADAGRVLGPRTFSTGPGIFNETDLQSLDDARNVIRRYTDFYRTHLLKSYMIGNRAQRQWTVQASQELHAMPTTEGGIDLRMDLTHVIDGYSGNEHNLPQTPLYKDVTQFWAESRTAETPTLVVAYGGPTATQYFLEHTEVHDDPKIQRFIDPFVLAHDSERMPWTRDAEYVFPQQAADVAKILRAGGNIGLGGHGQMQGIEVHWEMWAMAMGGMTSQEVLRVATIESAKAIGYEKDLGSIEAGKLADLVVLDKDPLADIHNTNSVHAVMRGGFIYSGDTLDEIYPEHKTTAPRYWQTEGFAPRLAAQERTRR